MKKMILKLRAVNVIFVNIIIQMKKMSVLNIQMVNLKKNKTN